ncbi:hypothetical protein K0M31_005054, partial [Melipona bicolor]
LGCSPKPTEPFVGRRKKRRKGLQQDVQLKTVDRTARSDQLTFEFQAEMIPSEKEAAEKAVELAHAKRGWTIIALHSSPAGIARGKSRGDLRDGMRGCDR